jgi:hypothetical protein
MGEVDGAERQLRLAGTVRPDLLGSDSESTGKVYMPRLPFLAATQIVKYLLLAPATY